MLKYIKCNIFQRFLVHVMVKFSFGSYEKYGLQKPDHRVFEQHPTINSELLGYMKLGKIIPHPDIKKFDDNVEFVDGERKKFDLVIFATGYKISMFLGISHMTF